MKYCYHVTLYFNEIQEEYRACFDSNSEELRLSELRLLIDEKYKKKDKVTGFHVLRSVRTIND